MQSDVLQLVTDLSNGLADPVRVGNEYLELLERVSSRLLWFEAQLVSVMAGTSVYTMPDGQAYIEAVLYDDRQLSQETRQGLEAFNPNWRDLKGDTPYSYFIEDEVDRVFRLIPQPTQNSKSWVPVFGSPMGLDYPPYSVCVIGSIQRDPFQWWLNLYVALMICQREFVREGANQDLDFAAACQQMADLILSTILEHGA